MIPALAAASWLLLPVNGRAEAQVTPSQPVPVTLSATNLGPQIHFAEQSHDFGIVAAGDIVPHIFVFTNSGDQTLEVTNVHPACGCTTAGEWTKRVEPGQTGTIPIQFNSTEFNGPVEKTVEVHSTDKNQPLVTLRVKGTVWRAIEVSPQFVVLNYSIESPTNPWTTVSIVNNLETPLMVYSPECNQRAVGVELKTNEPGRSYQLFVAVKPPLQRAVKADITLKTSSTNMPLLQLAAMVDFRPIMAVSPPNLVLPAPPLPNRFTNSVRIHNNGTNQVTVSDAAVDYQGVDVQLKEVVPGQTYSAILVFPEGFGLVPGRPMHLTVKTSHPKYPELKVPVLQMARTARPGPERASKPPNPGPAPNSAPAASGPAKEAAPAPHSSH